MFDSVSFQEALAYSLGTVAITLGVVIGTVIFLVKKSAK